ncbi:precorrin-3B synthase [Zavarzinia aquatilis]|uniref:Precorrin-3B synthase n=1 Tax=Zavarzinia aquatilis TaxID=2211142 RepID=A0A317DWB8_9PROT|nr:precorrin-3B synthase [Zavarzinia aquatilis]PWR18166.1 precorrin-3B synthase [Zavarzinia aquatilis]
MTGYEVKGWCPGALRPMASGDGLVARIRPHGGRLSAAQVAGIARAALAHGNGEIDLSARANLQLRGIAPTSHAALIADLAPLGLIDDGIEQEGRRNLVVTPLWSPGDGTMALAGAIEDALTRAPALPGKFGIALDTGAGPVLSDVSADIRVERAAGGSLIVRADGAPTGRAVTEGEVPGAILDLARWFGEAGGIEDGRGRMAPLLARGVALPRHLAGDVAPAAPLPPPGPGRHALGMVVGFAFGRLRAEVLDSLGRAGAVLRLTPWRMLLVEGVGALPDLPGAILDPADPRRRVDACTGAPDCPQAQAPVRALALALAPHVPAGERLHVSACAKGCAHPAPAATTLVAEAGGFALIRDGRAGDSPHRHGLDTDSLIRHPEGIFTRS